MTEVTTVYWRDIPAQVIVGRGRRGAKVQLSERFEQAVDRAAMRSGMAGTDAYLSEWRKVTHEAPDGDASELAQACAAELEQAYSPDRLRQLVENEGRAG